MSTATITTVSEHMVAGTVTVHPETEIREAISALRKHRVSGMAVVDERQGLVGFLSEKDCLEAYLNSEYHESPTALVRDVMSCEVATVDPETDVLSAAEVFVQKGFHCLPVLRQDRLVGLIRRRDVIGAIQAMHKR